MQALLTENFITRDTIVQENGKVHAEFDEHNKYHIFYTDVYAEKVPKNRELKIKKKLYEFYTAPITKFWANSVSIEITYFFNKDTIKSIIRLTVT